MTPPKDKILGIIAPVIMAEFKFDLMVETNMEFIHHARKVYDIETEVTLEYFVGEGFVLFQGRIIEDIYYVGLVDGIMRSQTLEKTFNGFRKNTKIKKGMLCRGTASIHRDNVINEIIESCWLRQRMLVELRIKVLREETIPRSLLVTGPLEHPVYRVGTAQSQKDIMQVYGNETRSDFPDMALDDPYAVLPPGNANHCSDNSKSEGFSNEETTCIRLPLANYGPRLSSELKGSLTKDSEKG